MLSQVIVVSIILRKVEKVRFLVQKVIKLGKVRFFYMICMIFNMPYMTISIDIQYIVRRGEKFDPNCSICDLIFVPGVRLKTRRHVETNPNCNVM